MTADDPRDRALDALLRSRRSAASPPGPCLDAELLAAYADGTLDEDGLSRADAHMADCARCQSVLAALVASEPEPEPQHAPAAGSAPSPWWRFDARWLMPLAGAATAVLVWSLRPEGDPARSVIVQEQRKVVAAEPQENAARRSEDAGAEAAPALSAPEAPAISAPEARADSPPAAAALQDQSRRAAETANERRAEAMSAAPQSAAPPPAAVPVQPREPDAPATLAENITVDPAPAPSREAAAQGFAAAAPREIPSGDAAVRWRVIGDAVERSVDGGATWTPTAPGPGAITAGSAPAATVCWIVGPGGTIRLTTDARTWRRLQGPTADDLVAVDADSDRIATIRSRAGDRFRTTDGGATWTPLR